MVMEYLGAHEIMRKALVAAAALSEVRGPHQHVPGELPLLHLRFLVPARWKKKEMQARFINPHLNKLQEDFVYTNPYIASPENKWNPLIGAEVRALRENAEVKAAIAEMKAHYMTHAEALIHADLHTGQHHAQRD